MSEIWGDTYDEEYAYQFQSAPTYKVNRSSRSTEFKISSHGTCVK